MRVKPIGQYDVRFIALASALVLYGFLGSPTPDEPGWVELIIGLLLVASLSIPRLGSSRMSFAPLCLIGLSIPLGIGLYGNAIDDIVRDVIPFLFLCLPFFIDPSRYAPIFIKLCLLIGVVFAARVLLQGLNIVPVSSELLYLSNSPLVLMAAIVGLGQAAIHLYNRRISVQTVLYFICGLICLLAMLIDVQRATIGAVIISLGVLGVIGLYRAPLRMGWPIVMAAIFIIAGWDIFLSTAQSIAVKTSLVGMNMRWQEIQAVYERLDGDWLNVLFGIGWGGMFDSPAVGGWSVPYTHSLLSYMTLKTGVVGLAATLIALFACFKNLLSHRSLLSLSLFWAIIIPMLFYASYKSFDFGLVLVLAVILPRAIPSKITS